MKTSDTPWLSREGKFRFEMGLRQGSTAFFGRTEAHAEILTARQKVLAAHPRRYAAVEEEGVDLFDEALAFARRMVELPGVGKPDDYGGDYSEYYDSLVASSVALTGSDSSLGRAEAECVVLGQAWEPDFLLLKPGPDGAYRLVGGCVCFPSSWDLREKLGQPLEAIHAPVPGLNAGLGAQISAFLQRIKPGVVWQRWNWGLAAVRDWDHHPALEHPRLDAGATVAGTWLRLEHQAFRQLGGESEFGGEEGHGLLFAIRISVIPLGEIARNCAAALRLAELLESMPEEIAQYKGLSTARLPLARELVGERGTD